MARRTHGDPIRLNTRDVVAVLEKSSIVHEEGRIGAAVAGGDGCEGTASANGRGAGLQTQITRAVDILWILVEEVRCRIGVAAGRWRSNPRAAVPGDEAKIVILYKARG